MNWNNYGLVLGNIALQLLLSLISVAFFLFIISFIIIAILRLQGYHWDIGTSTFIKKSKKETENGKTQDH